MWYCPLTVARCQCHLEQFLQGTCPRGATHAHTTYCVQYSTVQDKAFLLQPTTVAFQCSATSTHGPPFPSLYMRDLVCLRLFDYTETQSKVDRSLRFYAGLIAPFAPYVALRKGCYLGSCFSLARLPNLCECTVSRTRVADAACASDRQSMLRLKLLTRRPSPRSCVRRWAPGKAS